MPPRMTTRSAGRETAATQGGRTGGQNGGQGTKVNNGVDGVPDFSTIIAQQLQNLLPIILAQGGDQGSNLWNGRNQNGDNIHIIHISIGSMYVSWKKTKEYTKI
ncbi:hypothetical protein Tco_0789807 [Tanacetum coccineum]